jgi:hypothetical protein
MWPGKFISASCTLCKFNIIMSKGQVNQNHKKLTSLSHAEKAGYENPLQGILLNTEP